MSSIGRSRIQDCTHTSEIEKMLENSSAKNYLLLQHRICLNALDQNDPRYEKLETAIVEILCSQPSWGEKLPKSRIYLKLLIKKKSGKGR